jgi:hypothetical protein
MSGKPITQEQVNLYMSYQNNSKQTQVSAAAKAGFSERTARRIDKGEHNITHSVRQYRTRTDPFNGLFEQYIVPLLEDNPALLPITLFDVLLDKSPDNIEQSHLRTLQRRVKKWRAQHGPEQEVMFQQRHTPGDMGISDYTWMNKLNIIVANEAFEHKLYHYRLVYSGWTYVQVCLGGESFESLSSGLQNAFWRSGGVPATHRTDSLSAAFNNNSEKEVLTERYAKLCKHYAVKATRNNKGVAHENGAIESAHGHLKRKIDQQLILRGSRDFACLSDYETFINRIVSKINRGCKTRFDEERRHLQSLPTRRTNDFSEQHVKVSSSSTITIKRVTYTVPSRLIGSTLLVHIYDDRLVLFYGHEETLRLQRVYAQKSSRARSVDYRHVIHSLAKKPNAFRSSMLRDDLIPAGDFTLLWQKLTQDGISDTDCRYMVNLLVLADNENCEAVLGRYVLSHIERSQKPSLKQCKDYIGTDSVVVPLFTSKQHPLDDYDCLIGGLSG